MFQGSVSEPSITLTGSGKLEGMSGALWLIAEDAGSSCDDTLSNFDTVSDNERLRTQSSSASMSNHAQLDTAFQRALSKISSLRLSPCSPAMPATPRDSGTPRSDFSASSDNPSAPRASTPRSSSIREAFKTSLSPRQALSPKTSLSHRASSFSQSMSKFTHSFSVPDAHKVTPWKSSSFRKRRNTGGYYPNVDEKREIAAGCGGYEGL